MVTFASRGYLVEFRWKRGRAGSPSDRIDGGRAVCILSFYITKAAIVADR